MFSLKRSPEPNPTNIDPSSALPNNYGKIRTLEEDFENFQSGKKEKAEEIPPQSSAAPVMPPLQRKSPTAPLVPPVPFSAPQKTNFPPQQTEEKKDFPDPISRPASPQKTESQKEIINPFGSDNYFSEKSPFEELGKVPQPEPAGPPPKKKSSGLAVTLLSAFLVLTVLGGGFYYYWFFMRKPETVPVAEPTPAAEAPAKTPSEETPPSESVRAFSVDPSAGNDAFQEAFRETALDFLSDSSEGDLIEVRPVGSDNQQISISDFASISSLNLPAGVMQKLSASGYSLFVKKENGQSRAGMVMKLSGQTGVSEELLAQEKQLPSETAFLYLGQTLPPADPVFDSSKYKNADIRYYNFSSPENTSLDYSVIKASDGGYLIFATSKDSIRSILDYMTEK